MLVLTCCSPDRSSGCGSRDTGCRALPHVYRRGEETGVGRSPKSEIWGCLTVPLRVLFPVFGPSDPELPTRGWGTNLCELTDAVLEGTLTILCWMLRVTLPGEDDVVRIEDGRDASRAEVTVQVD